MPLITVQDDFAKIFLLKDRKYIHLFNAQDLSINPIIESKYDYNSISRSTLLLKSYLKTLDNAIEIDIIDISFDETTERSIINHHALKPEYEHLFYQMI
jgi:hypothetical protein